MDADRGEVVLERLREAIAQRRSIEIVGMGSKRFIGRRPEGEPLRMDEYRGVVAYEPTELYVTVRAGTPVDELEAVVAAEGQRLPFEPPRLAAGGTVGGVVATAWAGPSRPFRGGLRDALLGIRCLDGRGRILAFGGRVVKNVAGFDLSRLMAGAMGVFGPMLEVTLRLLPRPSCEATLVHPCRRDEAAGRMSAISSRSLPLDGLAWHDDRIWIRLSGSRPGVEAAVRRLGGETVENGPGFWAALRDHTLAILADDAGPPLWRLSVPPAAPDIGIDGAQVVDWGGGLRWLRTEERAERVHAEAERLGGRAWCFRGGDRDAEVLSRPPAGTFEYLRRVKRAFDPDGLFNPGRLHGGL